RDPRRALRAARSPGGRLRAPLHALLLRALPAPRRLPRAAGAPLPERAAPLPRGPRALLAGRRRRGAGAREPGGPPEPPAHHRLRPEDGPLHLPGRSPHGAPGARGPPEPARTAADALEPLPRPAGRLL